MPAIRGPVEDARDLHGQRRSARHDVPAQQPLSAGAQQRHRIDAGVAPEPAVFIVQQHLQVQRRDLFRRDRVTPDALRIGECAQRRAVARDDQGAGVALLGQRQRKGEVEHQQRQQEGNGAPAEQRQDASPAFPSPIGRRWREATDEGKNFQGHGSSSVREAPVPHPPFGHLLPKGEGIKGLTAAPP